MSDSQNYAGCLKFRLNTDRYVSVDHLESSFLGVLVVGELGGV